MLICLLLLFLRLQLFGWCLCIMWTHTNTRYTELYRLENTRGALYSNPYIWKWIACVCQWICNEREIEGSFEFRTQAESDAWFQCILCGAPISIVYDRLLLLSRSLPFRSTVVQTEQVNLWIRYRRLSQIVFVFIFLDFTINIFKFSVVFFF